MPKLKPGTIIPTDEEDAKINTGIASDPDTYEVTDFSKLRPVGRPKAENTKTPVSIRLSSEVLEYFRGTGKGWQTRLDEVLKGYVKSHQ